MKKLNLEQFKTALNNLKASKLTGAAYKNVYAVLKASKMNDADYKNALLTLRKTNLFDGFNTNDGYDLRKIKSFSHYQKSVIDKHVKILEFVNNKTLNGQFDTIHYIPKKNQPLSAIRTLNHALGYSHPDAKHMMSEKLKYIILPKLPNQKIKGVSSILKKNYEPVFYEDNVYNGEGSLIHKKDDPVLLKNGKQKQKEKDRIYRAIVDYNDLKLNQVITFLDTKKVVLNTDYEGGEDDIKDSLKTEYEREIFRIANDIDDGLNSYRLSSYGGDINPQYTPSPFLSDLSDYICMMIEKYKEKDDQILKYISGVSAWRTTKGDINRVPNAILGYQFTTHDKKQRAR